MTVYFGKKFKTIVRDERLPSLPEARELLRWCLILNNMSLVHGTAGEISFRTPSGFAITRNETRLNRLGPGDIVEVLEYSQAENAFHIRGRPEPSEESLLHHLIYRNRPEIGAVFHIHDATMLNAHSDLGIELLSQSTPEETARALEKSDAVAVRDNGLIFLGQSLGEAGNLIIQKSTEEYRIRLGRVV